jgi:hypothetical protein
LKGQLHHGFTTRCNALSPAEENGPKSQAEFCTGLWQLRRSGVRGLHSHIKQLATSWSAALRSWLTLSLFILSTVYFLCPRTQRVWEQFHHSLRSRSPASIHSFSHLGSHQETLQHRQPCGTFFAMAHFGLGDVRTCMAMSLRRISVAEGVWTSDRGHASWLTLLQPMRSAERRLNCTSNSLQMLLQHKEFKPKIDFNFRSNSFKSAAVTASSAQGEVSSRQH